MTAARSFLARAVAGARLDAERRAEDLPRAFDRGYLWARYRGTRTVGSGLGLAIVKALCDAMGVAVRADAGDGGGIAFRLALPPVRGDARPALSRPRDAGSPVSRPR